MESSETAHSSTPLRVLVRASALSEAEGHFICFSYIRSLNLAMSAGIVLYEALRQQQLP